MTQNLKIEQKRKKIRIPKNKKEIQIACNFALFLSLEEYFQDIAKESHKFMDLNFRVKFINKDFREDLQYKSDCAVKKIIKTIPKWFINSKVEILIIDNTIIITDGYTIYTFNSTYEKRKVNIEYIQKIVRE